MTMVLGVYADAYDDGEYEEEEEDSDGDAFTLASYRRKVNSST